MLIAISMWIAVWVKAALMEYAVIVVIENVHPAEIVPGVKGV